MNRLILLAALGTSALIAASPALADVEVVSTGPVVRLSVTETVKAKPDLAEVSAGVSSEAPTAVAAMGANARDMTAVIARIKALGIAEDDIQTTGVNLNPRYDYDSTAQRPIFRGYIVSNRVSVTLRNVDRTGPVLDALVAAGATDISGPSFSIDDDTAAKSQAREAAMKRAEGMARTYANGAGYSDVRLLQVSEDVFSNLPQPMMRKVMAAESAMDASTPIQPGMVGTNVTVSVIFEMTR